MGKQKLLSLFTLIAAIQFTAGYNYCVFNTIEAANKCTYEVPCHQSNAIALKNISKVSLMWKDVQFYFCSLNYDIEDFVRFDSKGSISFIGASNGSHFNCDNQSYGFHFNNIARIEIKNMTFNNCGAPVSDINERPNASIYIRDSKNIIVSNVIIKNTHGIGMVIINSSGIINITSSRFDNNSNYQNPGGGIFIVSSTSENTTYNIRNCTFKQNSAKIDVEEENYFRGGGLNVYFRDEATNVNMIISFCVFSTNTARNGGALSLSIRDSTHNVAVFVRQSEFRSNKAISRGGAVSTDFVVENMTENRVYFNSCIFIANTAKKGGGVSFYASPHYNNKNYNEIHFKNCTWNENIGRYGSAVYMSPYKLHKDGSLPIPIFQNCSFITNHHYIKCLNHVKYFGRGTLYLSSFQIKVQDRIIFRENENGSAVYLFLSILEVCSNSSLLFDKNIGYKGGAISLRGSASIYLNDNISIVFKNNSAINRGGAIFHEALSDPSNGTIDNCFMKYVGNNDKEERNITVKFLANNAKRGGSIYLYSAIPCNIDKNNTFLEYISIDDVVQTYPSNFKNGEKNLPKQLIPGKEEELNIGLLDDRGNNVSLPIYRLETASKDDIEIDSAYIITTNNKVKLFGNPGSKGKLLITLLSHEDMSFSLAVIMQECPPGYVHKNNSCFCSKDNEKTRYLGITRCSSTYNAIFIQGYWAGYNSEIRQEDNFRTSNCPFGYCRIDSNINEISLPHTADELNAMVCTDNRTGQICGRCENGSSVHYHTNGNFICDSEDLCHLGILFFILSEILPVTILFLVIIFLDIQLTTGGLNGFLFYMQVFSTLDIHANNFINFPQGVKLLLHILNSFANMFNLNFFTALKFCLYEGATTMDNHVFDYSLIVYSLFLIIITVICLNRRCSKCIKNLKGKRSITHGLSGFLVLCYAKTTIITLRILTPGYLHGKGSKSQEAVVFYQGNIGYFKIEHLKYAIPALFAAIFMTCLLPLLLLIYPLCYKILKVLRLEESKFSRLLCRAVPLEKFKPFFDSFQGAFKDNHRYFASLYFFYRLFILLSFAFASNLTDFYFLLELQLAAMIVLHGWIQPYKQQRHNMLDMYIFAILITLIEITSYNYQGAISQLDNSHTVRVLSTIQVLLAYSPVVFMLLYALYKLCQTKIVKNIVQKLRKKKENELELSLSMLDQSRDPEEVDYQKIE